MSFASLGAGSIDAVLFDLDGTLVDSAPDLAGAGNEMRVARGLPVLPLSHFRPMAGSGARGMVERALGVLAQDLVYAECRDEFLARYEARITRETQVFEGLLPVLSAFARDAMPWGIVTNKASRYSIPLMRSLAALDAAATLVCGDTTPHAKPHPAPLLEAARRLCVDPSRCIYVGDDLRDVQAGTAAGMSTVAVRWGYLGSGAAIEAWGASFVVQSPGDLLKLLAMA